MKNKILMSFLITTTALANGDYLECGTKTITITDSITECRDLNPEKSKLFNKEGSWDLVKAKEEKTIWINLQNGETFESYEAVGDRGFRVDPATGLCEREGKKGVNYGFPGECGLIPEFQKLPKDRFSFESNEVLKDYLENLSQYNLEETARHMRNTKSTQRTMMDPLAMRNTKSTQRTMMDPLAMRNTKRTQRVVIDPIAMRNTKRTQRVTTDYIPMRNTKSTQRVMTDSLSHNEDNQLINEEFYFDPK